MLIYTLTTIATLSVFMETPNLIIEMTALEDLNGIPGQPIPKTDFDETFWLQVSAGHMSDPALGISALEYRLNYDRTKYDEITPTLDDAYLEVPPDYVSLFAGRTSPGEIRSLVGILPFGNFTPVGAGQVDPIHHYLFRSKLIGPTKFDITQPVAFGFTSLSPIDTVELTNIKHDPLRFNVRLTEPESIVMLAFGTFILLGAVWWRRQK